MAFLNKIDPQTKRNVYAVSVLLLSLGFMPVIGPVMAGFLMYSIMGTMITPGMIIAAIGIFVAWGVWQRKI